MQVVEIHSDRLSLVPMTPDFLEASLDRDRAAAEAILGCTVPDDWWNEHDLMRLRLAELLYDPQLQPWLLRAIVLRQTHQMIGHIDFHTAPGAAYLEPYAPGGVEFGYTVFPQFRRQGYAHEASAALMAWAQREHDITRFVLSISPTNEPSLALARKFGFVQIGTYNDPEDGPEDIFERQIGVV